MLKPIFSFAACLIFTFSFAQINAITETGDEVILFEDGTWQYINDSISYDEEIPFNETVFEKDKKSTFLVKSKKANVGIWINPKEWSFAKGEEGEATEFKFQKKGDDFYAMLITENVPIPVETLKNIAVDNAANVAPDIKVEQLEYRTVNGLKVINMQMTGSTQGIRFTYYGYYFSNDDSSVQFVTYSGEKMMKNNIELVETLLNGFVEL